MCQGFNHLSGSLHHLVVAKLATSSIRVKKLIDDLLSLSFCDMPEAVERNK